MTKIFSSGASQKGKQSSGSKKNARLRVQKTSNLKKGINPSTKKSFLVILIKGENADKTAAYPINLYQTRIGAVKAKKDLVAKGLEDVGFSNFLIVPLSRIDNWVKEQKEKRSRSRSEISKRKVEISELQRNINYTKKIQKKVIKNGGSITNEGGIVTLSDCSQLLNQDISLIKTLKAAQNTSLATLKVNSDFSEFDILLKQLIDYYGE